MPGPFGRGTTRPAWEDGPFGGPFIRHGAGRPRWAEEEEAGRGGPFFGPFGRGRGGPGKRMERFLERGELKFVILDLLREQPRHGYDIIRALEDRFAGFYSPSPGVIYPTLQLLEDQGAVTANEQDGKRIYSLTEAGRQLLSQRQETMDAIRERMRAWGPRQHPEIGELMGEFRRFVRTLFGSEEGGPREPFAAGEFQRLARTLFSPEAHGWWGDPEKVQRMRAILAKARAEIEQVLHGAPTEPPAL